MDRSSRQNKINKAGNGCGQATVILPLDCTLLPRGGRPTVQRQHPAFLGRRRRAGLGKRRWASGATRNGGRSAKEPALPSLLHTPNQGAGAGRGCCDKSKTTFPSTLAEPELPDSKAVRDLSSFSLPPPAGSSEDVGTAAFQHPAGVSRGPCGETSSPPQPRKGMM